MTIHHHPNDATLMAYAAGSLAQHLGFVVATHLSLCPRCARRVRDFETLGGVELDVIKPTAVSSSALDNVLAMIAKPQERSDFQPANDEGDRTLPSPLRSYLSGGLDDVKWKNMAPGIKSYVLPDISAAKGSLRLLKISPGITIPEHAHTGNELTLVLRGSFSDEVGRFQAGDLADLDDSNNHQPIADTAEDCICLIATEAPLKFKAMLPKMMQYFIGM